MKSREELRNDYEEALFALIMDDIMELEGEELIAERERLEASDEYKVPDDVNERCLELINRCFDEKQGGNKKSTLRKVWRTALIAAIVMTMLVTSVCALVPEVRSFVMEIAERMVSFSFGVEEKPEIKNGKYYFGYIPDGFKMIADGYDDYSTWEIYESVTVDNARISLVVDYGFDATVSTYDFEDGVSKEIEIGDYQGLLIEKEDRCQAALYDRANGNFIDIIFVNVDGETILEVLENLSYDKYGVAFSAQ